MDSASSSKVTVEYHDPSGVFPLVSRDIGARLPLRNLNWQTHTRPLRQIRQLHVEFVPDRFTEITLRPPVDRFDSNGPTSFDIVQNTGKDGRKEVVKERRHQIPGLKTSPYLKVYVLRCDDTSTYKTTERARIKQWVRDNVHREGKENHDAFEWLILHVVVPDTLAASEARWRESRSEPDELKERKTSNVNFPGKPSRTVFDRLRADFNEPGKAGQDRVSQLKLLKQDVQPDLLATPAAAETFPETPQERGLAWKDLMEKFKVLILASFDTRVRQYEADVAGQEARRSLPGWNFCTFFIHKEGLAKAMESIGLVEDALAIYNELSFGLETVVRELASGQAEGTATTFASYTVDIVERVVGKPTATTNGASDKIIPNGEVSRGLFKSDLSYREKILRNDISVFDFFCYLFSRQKALLLRLAGTRASRAELGAVYNAAEGGEDLVLISEVCWRASSFIHNNARTLRQDIMNRNAAPLQADVDSIVCSWTYAMTEQILSETASPLLDLTQPDVKSVPNGVPTPKRADFSFAMGNSPYPQRMSSLSIRKPAPELQRPPGVSTDSMSSPPSSRGTDIVSKGAGIPGLPELTTYRAELVMLQRKILEQLAEDRGWRAGWAAVKHQKSGRKLLNIHLDATDGKESPNSDSEPGKDQKTVSVDLPQFLALAVRTESDFHSAFQSLSDKAMRYYALATQNKSVEVIIGDLAMLKQQQGDYVTAEDYLKHLLPSYATDGWSSMEAEVLSIYAKCLKQLGRIEEYVKTVLDLLAKVCGRQMARQLLKIRLSQHASAVEETDFDISGLLSEVAALSSRLSSDTIRPLEEYFGQVQFEREIMHLEDRDGFVLRLRFIHLLEDELQLDQVSARLVNADAPNQDIWLVGEGGVELKPGVNELKLQTTTNAYGAFEVDSLIIKVGKLRFTQNFRAMSRPTLRLNDDDFPTAPSQPDAHKRTMVFTYPAEQALDLSVLVARDIIVDKPRHLALKLSSGWNDVRSIAINIKPTSAGLRLHLADAQYQGIEQRRDEDCRPGQLLMHGFGAHAEAMIKLPYTVEQKTRDISMRFEVRYDTSKGSFTYLTSTVLRHELPLDVDVDDTFHLHALFSNFTIRTMRSVPLTITDTKLTDSSAYAVETPPQIAMPLLVFAESPAKLIFKISLKSAVRENRGRRETALALKMQYVATDELLAATLRAEFLASLKGSAYSALSRLLVPFVDDRCKRLFTGADLEAAVLLQQIPMPTFDDLGWADVVRVLPSAAQVAVVRWLKQWHREHSELLIDYNAAVAQNAGRHITVSVDVPTVDMIFSASLTLHNEDTLQTPGEQVLTIGKPVKADVKVTHSEAWSNKSVFGEDKTALQDARYLLEIQAKSDTWLICGPKRMHFTPSFGDDLSVGMTLVPLKLGIQHLPTVEVQPEARFDAESKPVSEPAVTCETHYESGGQTVEVIRDVRTTRVHIDETSASAGSRRPSTAIRSITEPG